MRRGEILGLRWSDVDLAAGSCFVGQALSFTKEGLIFGQPKTAKSRRTVTLLPTCIEGLKEHHRTQVEQRLAMGPLYRNLDLVCAQDDGQAWHPAAFTTAWQKFFQALEVPVRFHDLRHGHATHLLRLGINPKVVSERLGHSTIVLTLDTYGHVLPGMQEDAAAQLQVAMTKAAREVAAQAAEAAEAAKAAEAAEG